MEIWKDVEGYEGLYRVSNLGKVKRLDAAVWRSESERTIGHIARLKGRVMKQSRTRGDYLTVGLTKNGECKLLRVNRLVAQAFIPNPDNLPHAGHMDDNRWNNQASNLYWTDAQENNTHNDKHLRVGEKLSKPIIGCRNGEIVTFNSSLDAKKGGFNSSAIRNCLNGRSKTHKGYTWSHAESLNQLSDSFC